MKRALLCVLAATLLLATTAFATNGTRLIGFGTKMNGRGATGVGVFDSPSLMMTNPAGLTFLDTGSGLGVNLAMLTPSTSFKNSLNDKDGDKNYYPLGGLGYVSHPKKLPRLAWGAGLFTQGGMGADYELNHALFKDASG